MKKSSILFTVLTALIYALVCNAWVLVRLYPLSSLLWILLVVAANLLLGLPYGKIPGKLLKIQWHGVCCLYVFLFGALCGIGFHIYLGFQTIPQDLTTFLISAVWCVVCLSILFWNGIISVYCTSVQLGIRIRVIGILCGLIPIVNVFVLGKILLTCCREVILETNKHLLNEQRKGDAICKTKYPILLVHGVFFRDFKLLNYWGRIPGELEKNGATVYYGQHQSADSIRNSALELTERIRKIVEETGCEKVNIIAHSKGGLDCRCAISEGAAPMIASLTTVNTPHRGCGFADYLLEKIPESAQEKIALSYNTAAFILGDKKPDFMSAVRDLAASACKEYDKEWMLPDGIYSQSIGSQLKKATGGKFPLNFSYPLVKYFDGPNDGLVSLDSFQWGDHYTCLVPSKNRGISHGDMIDLNRENIPGFDVREFYVQLVSDLRKRGL